MEEGIKGANDWSRVLGSGFAHSNSTITDLSNQPRSRAEGRLFPGLLVTPPTAACGLIFPKANQFPSPRQRSKDLIISTITERRLERGPENSN